MVDKTRGNTVFEYIRQHEHCFSSDIITDMAAQGIPPSTTHRLLANLWRDGAILDEKIVKKGVKGRRVVYRVNPHAPEVIVLRRKVSKLETELHSAREEITKLKDAQPVTLGHPLRHLTSDIPPLRVTESHAPEYKPTEDEIRERERHERNKAIYEERS